MQSRHFGVLTIRAPASTTERSGIAMNEISSVVPSRARWQDKNQPRRVPQKAAADAQGLDVRVGSSISV